MPWSPGHHDERNAAIYKAWVAGERVYDIARRNGLTMNRIWQIVKQERERA